MKFNIVFAIFLLPLFFSGKNEPSSLALPLSEGKIVDLATIQPLKSAYAHNDYRHDQPLWDALSHGFTFLEVDVHLINDELVVAHHYPIFSWKLPTLKELYLSPLFELYKNHLLNNKDWSLRLMVDFKSNGEATYQRLKKELKPFEKMLTTWDGTIKKEGIVAIVISGNRPIETIANEKFRAVSVDGRLSDIGKGYDASLMPIISERFSKVCKSHLFGLPYSSVEVDRIKSLIQQTHAERKMIRFWQTPEDVATWELLLQNGIDWINTDELEMFSHFLQNSDENSLETITLR